MINFAAKKVKNKVKSLFFQNIGLPLQRIRKFKKKDYVEPNDEHTGNITIPERTTLWPDEPCSSF